MTVLNKIIEDFRLLGDEANLSGKDVARILLTWQDAEQQQNRNAYEAGYKRGEDQQNVVRPEGNIYPDLETYIQSLNQ